MKKLYSFLFLLLLVGACSSLPESPSNQKGLDLCKTDVKAFWYSDEEVDALGTAALKNSVVLNCTLHKFCGTKIPNPEACP